MRSSRSTSGAIAVQPLRGIVVAAVEHAVAAPICTRHLGDLGARVIKVENRAGGDFALSSALAALFARERTGRGTAISVGLSDAVAEWMGYALNQARYAGVIGPAPDNGS
jgi:crotonobetainyl-CoA:carnitine CoA-transferase CaiB-like acyl-CoA transferase